MNDESTFKSQADRIAVRRERIEVTRASKNKGGEKTVEKLSELVTFVQQRESFLQIQKSLQGIEEIKVYSQSTTYTGVQRGSHFECRIGGI